MKGHEFVMGDESMMSVRWMSKNFIDHMDKSYLISGHQENVIRYIR